jgi:hypothetical protein
MPETIHAASGFCARAASIISAELSTPTTRASGQRLLSTRVLLPGPQPRSTTVDGRSMAIRDARSTEGRVRSSANRKYR